MAFHVDVIPQALAEIDSIYRQIAPVAPENASRWLIGIADTIYSLESMPGRCPLAVAESEELAGQEVRLLLYGRHWARKELSGDELQELMYDLGDEA